MVSLADAAAELDTLGDLEMERPLTQDELDRVALLNDIYPGLADEAAGSTPNTTGPVR